MKMDQIQILKTQLDRIQESHPNLFTIWNTYLLLKEEKLQRTIEQVQSILINIEQQNIPDIPREAVMFLYCLRHVNI